MGRLFPWRCRAFHRKDAHRVPESETDDGAGALPVRRRRAGSAHEHARPWCGVPCDQAARRRPARCALSRLPLQPLLRDLCRDKRRLPPFDPVRGRGPAGGSRLPRTGGRRRETHHLHQSRHEPGEDRADGGRERCRGRKDRRCVGRRGEAHTHRRRRDSTPAAGSLCCQGIPRGIGARAGWARSIAFPSQADSRRNSWTCHRCPLAPPLSSSCSLVEISSVTWPGR